MKVLDCTKLVIGYNSIPLCEPIDLTVDPGQYVFVLGTNGAGKSSLIKTIIGLMPKISGTIDCSMKRIGYVPQRHDVFNDFPATCFEVVQSGMLYTLGKRPFYTKENKKAVKQRMESLNISNLEKKSFHQLSGGQKQKVLIARALMTSDEFLILDEPINGLDPGARYEVYDLLDKLHQKGVTIITISHDHEAAFQYGTHIVTLEDGKCSIQVNKTVLENGRETKV